MAELTPTRGQVDVKTQEELLKEVDLKRKRNRMHAKNSRQRKVDRLNQLETENAALRAANNALQEANNALQEQLLSDTTLFSFS